MPLIPPLASAGLPGKAHASGVHLFRTHAALKCIECQDLPSQGVVGSSGPVCPPALQRLAYRKGAGCARQRQAFSLRVVGCHVSCKASDGAWCCHTHQLGGLPRTTWQRLYLGASCQMLSHYAARQVVSDLAVAEKPSPPDMI